MKHYVGLDVVRSQNLCSGPVLTNFMPRVAHIGDAGLRGEERQ